MLPKMFNSTFNNGVSRLFDDDFGFLLDWGNRNFSKTETTLPSVNIQEAENEYIVEMAAPGMKKEDFKIELNNNLLTITSELKNEKEEKSSENYTRREFSYKSFQRSFSLNSKMIEESKIKAKYKNGILKVHLPKKDEVIEKPARVINISE